MKWKILTIGLVLVALIVPLAGTVGATDGEPPTQEEVIAAIANGVEWLAQQQNPDGFWGYWEECAVTALAVKKLEHHAVDPKWGLGLPSPFHDDNPYRGNIEKGLEWLFENCAFTMSISEQPQGNPDTDGDGIGVYFGLWSRTYTTGIALMTICEAVELDRVVESGPLAGWTYAQVAQDAMDYLAFGQNDFGGPRGGWGYVENQGWSDNSNTGYVTLGLGFAEAAPPDGCGFDFEVLELQFVKDELEVWINYIQNDPGDDPAAPWCDAANEDCDGGSGYDHPDGWVNILKTGNLLQQMAFVGDTAKPPPPTPRVQDALDYMERHWNDASQDPGWRGWPGGVANYQATFTAMKGFTALGIHEFGDAPIKWQADFETVLLAEQNEDGSWPRTAWDQGSPPILSTVWALLTLQKVAWEAVIQVPVDIKPQSCRNPLNVKSKGVLPVAILGTDDFDVTQVDPASVLLEGVSALRWDLENVATPFEPFTGKEDAFDCTDEGPDDFLDLTLKFDTQEVVAALGEVSDGAVLVLQLTGNLKEEYDGTPIVGEDVVVILKKGKK